MFPVLLTGVCRRTAFAAGLKPEMTQCFWQRKPPSLTLRLATMATDVRQELAQLMNSTGSHKDLAAKYVSPIIYFKKAKTLLVDSRSMLFHIEKVSA